jgi:hypothetical protein
LPAGGGRAFGDRHGARIGAGRPELIIEYESALSWSRVFCHVLVIYGDRDVSSGPPQPLVTIIRRGLQVAGNRDVTVKIFGDADHSICKRRTINRGADEENTKRIGPEFADGYLETMTDWLVSRFKRPRAP